MNACATPNAYLASTDSSSVRTAWSTISSSRAASRTRPHRSSGSSPPPVRLSGGVVASAALLAVVLAVAEPRFLSAYNLQNLARLIAFLGLIALGQGIVIGNLCDRLQIVEPDIGMHRPRRGVDALRHR